ncbi:hypothetical protein BGZ83_004430 [Gryganskiella cystojenkinii]|nr:hypothetical protein BGZ83_004430 [Gryganskiella cystojenkinii]
MEPRLPVPSLERLFSVQELCDHIALFLDWDDCLALVQVSKILCLGFSSNLWRLSINHQKTSVRLLRGLEQQGSLIRSLKLDSWTGRELLPFHLRRYCRNLASIEISNGLNINNSNKSNNNMVEDSSSLLTRRLFFDGEHRADEETEMDDLDYDLWTQAGTLPEATADLDTSNLERLVLSLTSRDTEDFIKFATNPVLVATGGGDGPRINRGSIIISSSTNGNNSNSNNSDGNKSTRSASPSDSITIATEIKDKAAASSSSSSLQKRIWAPRLKELVLNSTSAKYESYVHRLCVLSLPELMVAFPNARSWDLRGVRVRECRTTHLDLTEKEMKSRQIDYQDQHNKVIRLKRRTDLLEDQHQPQDSSSSPLIGWYEVDRVYSGQLESLSIERFIDLELLIKLLERSPRLTTVRLAFVEMTTATPGPPQIREDVFESLKQVSANVKSLYLIDDSSSGPFPHKTTTWRLLLGALSRLETLTLQRWSLHDWVFEALVAFDYHSFPQLQEQANSQNRTVWLDSKRPGLLHLYLGSCSFYDYNTRSYLTNAFRQWLFSPSGSRLVVLELGWVPLSVFDPPQTFSEPSTSPSADEYPSQVVDNMIDQREQEKKQESQQRRAPIFWTCGQTLEVLKIDILFPRHNTPNVPEDEVTREIYANRVSQQLERLVQLKTLKITSSYRSLPQRVLLLPPYSSSPSSTSESLLFPQLVDLECKGLLPPLSDENQVDQFLDQFSLTPGSGAP